MPVQGFSRKHGVSSFSFGYSGVFQTPEVRVTTVTLKQSHGKHLGIQEEPGEGVFCTSTHAIPLMRGWALSKTHQSYKTISDSVISVCPSHRLLLIGSLGPRNVPSSHIYTAPTDSELKLPKVLIWTSVKAFLQFCWSRVSLSNKITIYSTIFIFFQRIFINYFLKYHVLVVFFWQTVPRN